MSRKRHEEILNLLKKNTMMKIPDLCDFLQVSPATIRRDLAELESAGLISRINGGALLKGQHFAEYSEAHHISADPYLQQKKAIAEAAVTLVNPGDTIFIDPGSTNNQIANLLTSFSDISIVTNSIEIAYKFVAKKDISVIVCGGTIGEVDPRASIVGPLAEKMISMFRANICFLGTSGIDIKHGITDPYLSAARIKEKMIEHSSKVVLVTDHSKFGRVNKAFVSSLDNIHHVITDNQAPESDLDALTKMGITVTIV